MSFSRCNSTSWSSKGAIISATTDRPSSAQSSSIISEYTAWPWFYPTADADGEGKARTHRLWLILHLPRGAFAEAFMIPGPVVLARFLLGGCLRYQARPQYKPDQVMGYAPTLVYEVSMNRSTHDGVVVNLRGDRPHWLHHPVLEESFHDREDASVDHELFRTFSHHFNHALLKPRWTGGWGMSWFSKLLDGSCSASANRVQASEPVRVFGAENIHVHRHVLTTTTFLILRHASPLKAGWRVHRRGKALEALQKCQVQPGTILPLWCRPWVYRRPRRPRSSATGSSGPWRTQHLGGWSPQQRYRHGYAKVTIMGRRGGSWERGEVHRFLSSPATPLPPALPCPFPASEPSSDI